MSTYQWWCHLKGVQGVWGVMGVWGVFGNEDYYKGRGSTPMGPYLPIKIVYVPIKLCGIIWGIAHWGKVGVVMLCY